MPKMYTLIAEKSLNDVIDPKMPEIGICLSATDEKDGLTGDVGH